MPESATYLLTPETSSSSPRLPPLCILLPIPSFLRRYTAGSPVERSLPFDFVTTTTFKDGSRFLVGPFSGAPALALLMERLIPRGVKMFILLGTCGSLKEGLETGDIIIPSSGISEEGVSSLYGYAGRVPPPCIDLRRSLMDAFKGSPVRVHGGGVWSTDAPYMETSQKVDFYGGKGAGVVDMESTALFSIAKKRGVSAVSLLVVSDQLLSGSWQPGFYSKSFKRGVGCAIELTRSFDAMRLSRG